MKKFRLPPEIKVGAATYKIRESPTLRDDREHDAEIDFRNQIVTFQSDMPPEATLETFIHEAVHLVARDRRINLRERDCDQLAAGLAQVAVDNGWRL